MRIHAPVPTVRTAAVAVVLLVGLTAAAAAQDPWTVLQDVRKSLVAAGPTQAEFVQSYTPAGFTQGERETGRVAFALPDCLRWDYQEPYPKSYLLCGGVAHAWNSADKTGRRYAVDREKEPGLDLLLLGVDDLKNRYRATAKKVAEGRLEIALQPTEKLAEGIADAILVVDPASRRIVEIVYHDREQNLTRFTLTGYRALPRQGQFSPPSGIRWEQP